MFLVNSRLKSVAAPRSTFNSKFRLKKIKNWKWGGEALFLSYGRLFAEFLSEGSFEHLSTFILTYLCWFAVRIDNDFGVCLKGPYSTANSKFQLQIVHRSLTYYCHNTSPHDSRFSHEIWNFRYERDSLNRLLLRGFSCQYGSIALPTFREDFSRFSGFCDRPDFPWQSPYKARTSITKGRAIYRAASPLRIITKRLNINRLSIVYPSTTLTNSPF